MGLSFSPSDIFSVLFLCVSIALSVIDMRTRLIPNRILYPTILSALIFILFDAYFQKNFSVLAINMGIPTLVAMAFFLLYLINPRGLGMGDIKAIFFIGLILCIDGARLYFYSLTTSFVLGSIVVIFLKISRVRAEEIPFAPFLLLPASIFALLH